jgi:acyl transferase domain-containing protein/NADP-dependent 3-hydroxy acid dehydrogenase YdfG/acyl carrier protein
VLDDGVIEALDRERLDRVMRPKVDAAWHLHELTAGMELSGFILFSSAASLVGGAAQANYSAANAFLDALARHRRAEGLPAVSLAWGLWGQRSGLAGGLDEAEVGRVIEQIRQRLGFTPMQPDQGLDLFGAALGLPEPLLAPAPLDSSALRAQASAGTLPAVLRGLVRVPARRDGAASSLAVRLAGIAEEEREAVVLELVRSHAAAVLGHGSSADIDPDRAFREHGFDSLGAVELRNRLGAATGLRLAPALVFDYPNPRVLAGFLLSQTRDSAKGKRPAAIAAVANEEPIAIVGIGCRFPGGADSPELLWQLLEEGRDGMSGFPTDRGWDLERLADPERGIAADEGGFLHDAPEFDAAFFGVSPREAEALDPQLRMISESTWAALEDAGIDPHSLHGSQAGVFAGGVYHGYGLWVNSSPGLEGYTAPGGHGSIISGAIAYNFGLQGPAITVDTACSSSLVALHLAARALRQGECALALAGGVTVLASPAMLIQFSFQGALAPNGRCKAFADGADGTALADGVGMLVLERLSDAQRNDRTILSVIKGSAVNQDGASNGLSAPNGPSQERVIRQALANAGLEPKDIDAVEAHGTGTTLGDPIEAGALLTAYGQDRETPVRLGTIKSNIGHTQAAAGVAGVIKMTLAMREGLMPKTLHVDAPSTKVDWEAGKVELLTEARPWETNGRPRRAGISSFGASGTNAHLILEQAPEPSPAATGGEGGEAPAEEPRPLSGPVPFVLSAKSEPALARMAADLAAHLRANPAIEPTDVAWSLATARAAFEHRAVALGSDRGQLLDSLAVLAEGGSSAAAQAGRASTGKLAYLFSGQGSQRPGMGAGLHESHPAFRDAFAEVCGQLSGELGEPLEEIVFAADEAAASRLADTAYAQPGLFAVEVALFRALESQGLVPDLLAGHSIGELAAAHVAGVLDLAAAARLVAARGRLMGELPRGGAMVAVEASEEEARESLQGVERELAIAAINGPRAVVFSGTEAAVDAVQAHWGEQGRKTKRLAVSHAFHSPLIEPMLDEFGALAQELEYGEPRIPIVSNLTGELLTAAQAADPAYWVSHARQAVRFADSIATLAAQGARTYVELGPDPVLGAPAQQCLEGLGVEAAPIPTLREGRPEEDTFTAALALAHVQGAKLDWDAFFAATGAGRVKLPTYPFRRKRYWLSSTMAGGDARSIGLVAADHPLLGAAIEDPSGDGLALTGRLSVQTHGWIADHAVAGAVMLPGTAFVELALRAAREVDAGTLAELTLQAPLILPEQGSVQLQVRLSEAEEDGRRPLSIHSRAEGAEDGEGWTCHTTGVLSTAPGEPPEPLGSWPPEGAEPIEVEGLYDRLGDVGIEYGPAFACLTAAWRRGEEVFAEVSLGEDQASEAQRFAIHPALLDSSLHAVAALALADADGDEGLVLPFAWSGVRPAAGGASSLRVRLVADGDAWSLAAYDETGTPVVSADSVLARPVDRGLLQAAARRNRPLYRVEWSALEPQSSNGSAPAEPAVLGESGIPAIGGSLHPDLPALLAAIDSGADAPRIILADLRRSHKAGEGLPAAAHDTARTALELALGVLAAEPLADARLVVLADAGLAAAPLAGLLRSAHSEHPGRFCLIETDGSDESIGALPAALVVDDEPRIALRQGAALAPRLARVAVEKTEPAEPIDPERTVLISGGTSGLGALIARHLASAHGVRRLLLISRRGEAAEGAAELASELEALGAAVTIAACDVADRDRLEELLESIPAEHPLGAVVHSAAVLDDGILASLDAERLERAMRPKVDAAWHLHELTAGMELSQFLLFSSAAGLLGNPGQANYAAANTFLDALAEHRRAEGLPAVSLAWGGWAQQSEMGAALSEGDLARLRRLGYVPMAPEQGLELFDAARALPESVLAPVAFDTAALRSQAKAGSMAPILRGIVRAPARREVQTESLAKRLAAVPEAEHEAFVLDLVRSHAAAVLGHAAAAEVEPDRPFQELGFDSLGAVELRNRLGATTGLRLPPTLAFDYPNASAVAAHLLAEVGSDGVRAEVVDDAVREALERLGAALASGEADGALRERVGTRLRSFLVDLSQGEAGGDEGVADGLESMSHEEMFELIDDEFGVSDGG